MRHVPTPSPDPALQRLREVAERIRRRSAAGLRQPRVSRSVPPLMPAPAQPPPPHWADDQDRGTDERH